ncbi:MAG: hypothetical protein IPJ82_24520, partial [Lewinellaceae bacterium]|nr:hypothetical protein [Lewinellaceae bacterium]
ILPGPVAGTPGSLDDEIGQSAVKPFSSEEISLIDETGQITGRKIRVDRYWDKEQLYIFREDLLELYLLPGKDLPKPAVLIEEDGVVFLKMPDGSRLHLEMSGKEMPF